MSAGTDYLAKPILDWLRERADGSLAGRKYREAADEIERLRGVLAKAQNDLEDERRQRHFTAGETEKVIRALHAAAVQPIAVTGNCGLCGQPRADHAEVAPDGKPECRMKENSHHG